MEFFNVVKATQKSGKKDAVIWRSAKSEARANLSSMLIWKMPE
ncbi:Uncharacterised protein [Kluyvera cryocrescens]|uniref:Uncharacterized protein n=1 Tax=Kluyvera cryocrescens TaxID=580 RepID=A0A485BRR0_KLUCR|nr:Uncharacterised protein [Kluyvera cryocrescens]